MMEIKFKTKNRDDWIALMGGSDACFAPVLEMDEGHQFAKGHPGMHIFPALLAAARNREFSGEEFLRAFIIGYDTGYFLNCAISTKLPKYKPNLDLQVYGDIRDKSKIDFYLDGVAHVIQLAAISNDPMGNEFEKATIDINQLSSVYLARKCIELEIKSFTFASSCSVYGDCKVLPNHESIKNLKPTSPYALSKLDNEKYSMQSYTSFCNGFW